MDRYKNRVHNSNINVSYQAEGEGENKGIGFVSPKKRHKLIISRTLKLAHSRDMKYNYTILCNELH